MKKFSFLIVMLLIAGFIGFTGCDPGDDGNGTPSGPSIDPPTGLTAEAQSDSEILLNWSYASDQATFILEKTDSGDDGWRIHVELQAGIKTYTDEEGVSEGKTYQYRVEASLNLETSNPSDAVTVFTPPIPPTDLMVADPTNASVSLSWTDASSVEDGYEVQRKIQTAGEEDYESITTTDANAGAYVDLTVSANSTYNYRVRAVFNELVSPWSNEITATTAVAPSGLIAEAISDSEVELTWEDAGSGYRLEHKTIDAAEWTTAGEMEVGDSTYTDTGLDEATAWLYRIYSVIEAGESEPSETAMAITLPIPPENFSAEQDVNTTNTIIVTWTDKSSKESRYELQRRVGSDGGFQGYSNFDADTESFRDTELNDNQTYYYRIAVVAEVVIDEENTVEVSSAMSDFAAATTSILTPNPPTDFSAEAVDHTSIALTWTDNSDNEIGFIVLRGLSRFGVFTSIQTTAIDAEGYTDTGLEEEVQYFYKVFAFNADGNSDTTAVLSVITPEGPPAAPQNLVIEQVGYAHLSFSWDDVSDNEHGFVIDRSVGSDDNWLELPRLLPDSIYYYDRDIQPLTEYYYRIYAFNQMGNSDYSNIISATSLIAPPLPPSGLDLAGNPTLVRIPLTWVDNSDNESGFIIERRAVPSWNYTVLATLEANNDSSMIYTDRFELEGNTEYGYHVAAFNSSGSSRWSLEKRITTPPVPPQAPINLTAVATNLTEVDLNWEYATFNDIIDFYEIERRDGPDEEFEYLSETEGLDGIFYHDTGLEPDEHTYWYRVRATNEGGSSDWSGIAVVTTPELVPPENLSVGVAGITSLWTEWTYQYEVNFVIERSDTEMGEYFEVGTSDTTYFVDSQGLEPDSSVYWYRVKVVIDVHESEWSDPASGATPFVIQLDEGFEDWEVDADPPDPWFYNAGGGAFFTATDTVAHAGRQSLHFVDPADGAFAIAAYDETAPISAGIMSFWLKLTPGGTFLWYGIGEENAGSWPIVFGTVLHADGGVWSRFGVDWRVLNYDWSTEDWFFVRITWSDGSYSVEIDDDLMVDNFPLTQDIPLHGVYYLLPNGGGYVVENGWIDELVIQYDVEEERRIGPRRYTEPANPICVDPNDFGSINIHR